MATQLFLTALIACSTGQATCDSYSVADITYVNVCGVVPIEQKERLGSLPPRKFDATVDGQEYVLTLNAFCEGM
jgi:hypothetical protein